jgi:tetratricopeptide (TPR) repeat protein
MKKVSILIVIALILVGALGGGYYWLKKKNEPPQTITYMDVVELESDIARLEGLKKTGGLSWQDTYRLGVAYIQSGRTEDAARVLEEAERLYPNFYKTYESLGMAYFRLGEMEKAVAKWKKAMEMSNQAQHLEEIIERARMKLELNKRIAALEDEIKEGEVDWRRRFELALLFITTNRTEEARGQLEEILKSKKDIPDVYSAIAQSHAKDGDFAKAVEAQKEAVELNPEDENLKKRLSEMERIREGLKKGGVHNRQ